MIETAHEPLHRVCYSGSVIERRRADKNIVKACEVLRYRLNDFDSIAFRGMSGALIGPILGHLLNKTLLMVRKTQQNSHAFMNVEGDAAAKRYLIVDDFIGQGETVRAIIYAVQTFAPKAQCIGVLEMEMLSSDEITGGVNRTFCKHLLREKDTITYWTPEFLTSADDTPIAF